MGWLYLRGVRPHCRAGDGVVLAPDTTGSAPLLLNPRSGGGLCKMSRLLVAFFMATAGVHITATRLRSIMHSAVHTHCSSRQLREYSRGDTHSSRTAEVHYLKVTSPLFRPPLLHSPPPSTTIYLAQIAAVDVGVRAASAHATMLQAAVPMPEGEVMPPPPPLPVAVLPADPDPRPQQVEHYYFIIQYVEHYYFISHRASLLCHTLAPPLQYSRPSSTHRHPLLPSILPRLRLSMLASELPPPMQPCCRLPCLCQRGK